MEGVCERHEQHGWTLKADPYRKKKLLWSETTSGQESWKAMWMNGLGDIRMIVALYIGQTITARVRLGKSNSCVIGR